MGRESSAAHPCVASGRLVERRDATLDDELERLLAAAADVAGRPVDEPCDEVIARLRPEHTDDIALLALGARAADPAAR